MPSALWHIDAVFAVKVIKFSFPEQKKITEGL